MNASTSVNVALWLIDSLQTVIEVGIGMIVVWIIIFTIAEQVHAWRSPARARSRPASNVTVLPRAHAYDWNAEHEQDAS